MTHDETASTSSKLDAIDRRRFLFRAAALTAGAVGATNALASAAGRAVAQPVGWRPVAAPKRTLRKAVGLGMVGDPKAKTLVEQFTLLRELGFEGVEVDRPSGVPRDELLAAQEKSGVKIHGVVDSVHWSKHLNDPDPADRKAAIDGLVAAIDDAQAFGSVSVLLVPCVVNEKLTYDDAWTRSITALKEVLPHAADAKVAIAIENVWNGFLQSPLEAARYVDELGSPWARFHFDIGNVVNYGFPEQWIRVLGKRIVKLHVKDFSRKKRNEQGLWKGFDVELGDGDANYAAVMKALDDVGFSTATPANWATAEVGGGDRARLAQVASQMDKLFAM